jgi:hypothetical protein
MTVQVRDAAPDLEAQTSESYQPTGRDMTGYITYMAAREHANDLLRAAEARRCPIPPRPSRPPKLALARLTGRRAPRAATVAT